MNDQINIFGGVTAAENMNDVERWSTPARPIRCAIFGVGNRGVALGMVARTFANVEIAWVVDASAARVASAVSYFGGHTRGTTNIIEPLADPDVDVAVIAVPDHLHRRLAEPAFEAGKHVLLEKPLATTMIDARAILSAWQRSGRILQLGYVLRQTQFYRSIRDLVRENVLGPVRIISMSEQLAVSHGASFMRRWHAQKKHSGGLIVHKACHDLDLVCWLLDASPRFVSSFGGLDTFRGPPPAMFCSECDRRLVCPYVDAGLHERRAPDEAVRPSDYGLDRCVFRLDKDIVDNQVVSFELNTGIRGTFHLAMQGPTRSERRITIIGDHARLEGIFEEGRFVVDFVDANRSSTTWLAGEGNRGGHQGGDHLTMLQFLNACAGRGPPPVIDSEQAGRGLVFALAAEQARLERSVVEINEEFAL